MNQLQENHTQTRGVGHALPSSPPDASPYFLMRIIPCCYKQLYYFNHILNIRYRYFNSRWFIIWLIYIVWFLRYHSRFRCRFIIHWFKNIITGSLSWYLSSILIYSIICENWQLFIGPQEDGSPPKSHVHIFATDSKYWDFTQVLRQIISK